MSKEQRLEDFIRLVSAGGHTDARRSIIDVPVGYLHGRNVAVSNIITLGDSSNSLPLGQHFHINYGEVFALVHGSGDLYVRAVAPGETNKIDNKIVVAQDIPIALEEDLFGTQVKLSLDSKDSSRKLVRVVPGVAHTFILAPGSVLIPYLIDAPKDFNPSNPSNYVKFPLI